jgi:hypothetical protein
LLARVAARSARVHGHRRVHRDDVGLWHLWRRTARHRDERRDRERSASRSQSVGSRHLEELIATDVHHASLRTISLQGRSI